MEDNDKKYEFSYMMLSRLQSDCRYFMGWGRRSERVLWAGNVERHITEMKRIWNEFPEGMKPQWLTMEGIIKYETEMKRQTTEMVFFTPEETSIFAS